MTDSAAKMKKPTCFVISPIGAEGSDVRRDSNQVLKHLIRKALSDDFEIKRGDEDNNPGSITSQIVESILEADLVIADLTGFNPNVYYEVAIAHGYDRPTVHLQHADERPAFDLQDMRVIRYNLLDLDNLDKAQEALKSYASFAMENPRKALTPLSDAKRFVQIADSADPVAQSNAEVIEQLRSVRVEMRRGFDGKHTSAVRNLDIPSLRKIVERAALRGVLDPSDFESVISSRTGPGFDRWSRRILSGVLGETDQEILDQILVLRKPDEEESDDVDAPVQ